MEYRMEVSWMETGVMHVDAESEEEAIRIANEDLPLPEGEYVDGSFTVDIVETENKSHDVSVSFERILQILQQYVENDLEAADIEYVREALEECGVDKREAELLGLGYIYD